jgi:hypothetical protein
VYEAAPPACDDPHKPPPCHDQIMSYMRERPGCSYEAARVAVLYG